MRYVIVIIILTALKGCGPGAKRATERLCLSITRSHEDKEFLASISAIDSDQGGRKTRKEKLEKKRSSNAHEHPTDSTIQCNQETEAYDQYMKDFEATGRQIKQESKHDKMVGSLLKRESPNVANGSSSNNDNVKFQLSNDKSLDDQMDDISLEDPIDQLINVFHQANKRLEKINQDMDEMLRLRGWPESRQDLADVTNGSLSNNMSTSTIVMDNVKFQRRGNESLVDRVRRVIEETKNLTREIKTEGWGWKRPESAQYLDTIIEGKEANGSSPEENPGAMSEYTRENLEGLVRAKDKLLQRLHWEGEAVNGSSPEENPEAMSEYTRENLEGLLRARDKLLRRLQSQKNNQELR